jgi:hypothetical protein
VTENRGGAGPAPANRRRGVQRRDRHHRVPLTLPHHSVQVAWPEASPSYGGGVDGDWEALLDGELAGSGEEAAGARVLGLQGARVVLELGYGVQRSE